jgi:hypothetical protein
MKVGDRIRLSELGQRVFTRKDRSGVVTSVSATGTMFVRWDGRISDEKVHPKYLMMVSALHPPPAQS